MLRAAFGITDAVRVDDTNHSHRPARPQQRQYGLLRTLVEGRLQDPDVAIVLACVFALKTAVCSICRLKGSCMKVHPLPEDKTGKPQVPDPLEQR